MENEIAYGDFYKLEDESGNVSWYSSSEFTFPEVQSFLPKSSNRVILETGYFVRVDPDETWIGPFDSEEEAADYLEEIGF